MPRLTPTEKQDVIRFLEADKPLPDKYRFLLFDDKREVELVWNGKTSEVCNLVLPFQVIEQVDEPREETKETPSLFNLDKRGRQLSGWTNKLIWGDNKIILSSLKNGPMREEIDKHGGIKLIYIDPPFDVRRRLQHGHRNRRRHLHQEAQRPRRNRLPRHLGQRRDSFISMLFERLFLLRDLLSDDGSIYVHMGPNVSFYVRAILVELFGGGINGQITWQRTSSHGDSKWWGVINDDILFFTKSEKYIWNGPRRPFSDDYIETHYSMVEKNSGRRFSASSLTAAGTRQGETGKPWRGFDPNTIKRHWAKMPSDLDRLDSDGRIYWPQKDGG